MFVKHINRVNIVRNFIHIRPISTVVTHNSPALFNFKDSQRNVFHAQKFRTPQFLESKKNITTCSTDSIASYEEIKDLTNHPEKLLIDVREAEEVKQTGSIPTSINIPLKTLKETLTSSLAKKNFKENYGRNYPEINEEIIFTCLKGVRAQTALEIAAGVGFKNVKNYKGSWLDWAEREGLPKPT